MKKKWMIGLCIAMCALSGCGKSDGESSSKVQDGMTTQEAMEYEQELLADNVDESDNEAELLENKVDKTVDNSVGKESESVLLTDIPKEYEKVWELEKDNILLEFFNSSDGETAMCKATNGNPFDVNIDVEYMFRSANPMDPNNIHTNAVGYTVTANQVYYEFLGRPMELDSWIELNEGKDYWYWLNDEKVVNGVSFEILGWNEERSELEYRVTNNMDRNVTFIQLEWILMEDGNAVDVAYTRVTSWDERPLYTGESRRISQNPFGKIDSEKQKLMVSYCYDTALRGNNVYEDTQEHVESTAKEFAQIETEYGAYLFSVTDVKIVPSKNDENHEKLYQIAWEYENIDFGEKISSYVSLPDSVLHIVDSDGYIVEHRTEFEDGEASNRDGVALKSGEKCKAYSVFNVNNEECEYLTIAIDAREGSTFKVYVEK